MENLNGNKQRIERLGRIGLGGLLLIFIVLVIFSFNGCGGNSETPATLESADVASNQTLTTDSSVDSNITITTVGSNPTTTTVDSGQTTSTIVSEPTLTPNPVEDPNPDPIPPSLPTPKFYLADAGIYNLAADADGNIIASGNTGGSSSLVNTCGSGVIVGKFNPSGATEWAVRKQASWHGCGWNLLVIGDSVYFYQAYQNSLESWSSLWTIFTDDGIEIAAIPHNNIAGTKIADDEYIYESSADGKAIRKLDFQLNLIGMIPAQVQSFVLFNGNFYTSMSDYDGMDTVKYDLNGNKIWERSWRDPNGGNPAPKKTIVDLSGVYVFGVVDVFAVLGSGENNKIIYEMVKYDLDGNLIKSRSDLIGTPRSAAINGDYLYATGDNGLIKFSKADLSTVWHKSAGAGNSLVIVGGIVYISNGDAALLLFDAETGDQLQ